MNNEKYYCILFDLFWSVIVIVTLGGAAIFIAVLQIISICKEVLPLFHFCYDQVYSAKKTPVGGAAIITKLTICHIILLPSKSTIYQKYCCVSFFCLVFCSIFVYFIHSFIPTICYSFCTDLLNLFAQIYLIAFNIKTSVGA